MRLPGSPIAEALEDLRRGRAVLLKEGDGGLGGGGASICLAAELVGPEAVNFMATHGRGLVCLVLTEEKMRELRIPLLGDCGRSLGGCAFGASIEARHGVTTGISAHDRATTIRAAVRKGARP